MYYNLYHLICINFRDDIPMILVANKIDLDQVRVVSSQDGQELAKILKVFSLNQNNFSLFMLSCDQLHVCDE